MLSVVHPDLRRSGRAAPDRRRGQLLREEKVKKTFQYRAQVPEAATCAAGVSNTEKVKIKKPK